VVETTTDDALLIAFVLTNKVETAEVIAVVNDESVVTLVVVVETP